MMPRPTDPVRIRPTKKRDLERQLKRADHALAMILWKAPVNSEVWKIAYDYSLTRQQQ